MENTSGKPHSQLVHEIKAALREQYCGQHGIGAIGSPNGQLTFYYYSENLDCNLKRTIEEKARPLTIQWVKKEPPIPAVD